MASNEQIATMSSVAETKAAPGTPVEVASTSNDPKWKVKIGYSKFRDMEDPDPLVTSWFVSPKWVFALRLVLTCWQLGILIACVVTTTSPTYWLTYFTNITFTALTAVMVGLTILSGMKVFSKDPNWKTSPNWLAMTMKSLAPIQPPIHFVVTIAYWALLAKGFQFLSLAEHGLEFVVACIEWWFCNRLILTYFHLLLIVNVGLSYMFLSWVFYATLRPPGTNDSVPSNGYWVYGFLDWSKPINAAYYILIVVLLAIGFFLFMILTDKVRDRYGAKKAAAVAPKADLEMAPVAPAVQEVK